MYIFLVLIYPGRSKHTIEKTKENAVSFKIAVYTDSPKEVA